MQYKLKLYKDIYYSTKDKYKGTFTKELDTLTDELFRFSFPIYHYLLLDKIFNHINIMYRNKCIGFITFDNDNIIQSIFIKNEYKWIYRDKIIKKYIGCIVELEE